MLRPSLIVGFVALLALPLPVQRVLAQQQDNSSQQQQNPAPAPTDKPAPPKKDQPKKSTPQANPFPESQSEAAAHQQQNPDTAPDAPQPKDPPQAQSTTPAPSPSGPQAKPSTADQNPFPEEQSRKAAHEDPPADKPDAAPPDADDQSFSSSHVKGLDMPTTQETPPANLPPSPLPFDPKLAKKDAYVGDYYMESGNWKGAYDRFLEANRSDPGNAEAVFGLGESARHLHHDDEAIRNFRLYLSALPYGPHAKEIHKALKEMGVEH